jgi:hypothetical protein
MRIALSLGNWRSISSFTPPRRLLMAPPTFAVVIASELRVDIVWIDAAAIASSVLAGE